MMLIKIMQSIYILAVIVVMAFTNTRRYRKYGANVLEHMTITIVSTLSAAMFLDLRLGLNELSINYMVLLAAISYFVASVLNYIANKLYVKISYMEGSLEKADNGMK